MNTYLVDLTLPSIKVQVKVLAYDLDGVYEAVAWDYPSARIIGPSAIQRIS